jgi:hypothetical protein
MVSAVSGQTASPGLFVYKATDSDGGAQLPGPGQIRDRLAAAPAASSPSEDSAVKLTLSQDALDHLAQLPSPPSVADRMAARLGVTLQEGQDPEAAARQYFDDKAAQGKLRGEISMLNVRINLQARAKAQLRHNQDEYSRVLNTKPVPRQELSGTEKDAAVKLMESLGYQWPGKGQTRMFAVDNTMYLFKGDDRSVWTNQGDIPVSDENKQFWLGHLSSRISEGQRDMTDVISNRDAMQAQHDALAAKYAPPASQ